jgi:dTDP-4-amino-4,6-dideoxygalactose transaminase
MKNAAQHGERTQAYAPVSDIQGALGLVQLERLPELEERRSNIAASYLAAAPASVA